MEHSKEPSVFEKFRARGTEPAFIERKFTNTIPDEGLEDAGEAAQDVAEQPAAKRLKMSRSCGVRLEDAHRGHLPAPAAGKKQAPAALAVDPGRRRTGGGRAGGGS